MKRVILEKTPPALARAEGSIWQLVDDCYRFSLPYSIGSSTYREVAFRFSGRMKLVDDEHTEVWEPE